MGLPKLTEEQVHEVYVRAKLGKESAFKLAKEYGLHHRTVRAIRNKRSWRELTDAIDREE